MTAQYLLRFDDLCPTMDRARWVRFAELVARFGIKPILAVVPENCDPELVRDAPFAGFWEEMRAMEAAGAAIGLHGYRHTCETRGRGLIPLHERTEFAGVPRVVQREWIAAGLARLRSEGLRPTIWVAPRHGSDGATLGALRDEGIGAVSDGFARRPYREGGVVWIPQQLWGPVEKRSGLWTIGVHANLATEAEYSALEGFVGRFAARFTSVERVLAEWPVRERSVGDRLFHARMMGRIRLARLRRRV